MADPAAAATNAAKGITVWGTTKFIFKAAVFSGASMSLGAVFAVAHAGPAAQALSTAVDQGSIWDMVKSAYAGWGELFSSAKTAAAPYADEALGSIHNTIK